MSSFEPLLPALAGKAGFAPLAVGTVSGAEATATPFPDLNRQAPPPVDEKRLLEEQHAVALQAAHERGVAEGRAAAERDLADKTRALGEAVHEVARFRRALLQRYQAELLDLALEVARKVVDRELEQHPEHWLALIKSGVLRALDRDHVRIRVAPALHAFLREHIAELGAGLEGVKDFDLIEDPALAASGCVIETSYGDLDIGIDGQIATIRAALGESA
jgi:flagellar assembly protein FliH